MSTQFETFRVLFQRLVLASALPLGACSSTVVGSDAAVGDAPSADQPPADADQPPDVRSCAPRAGTPSTCTASVVFPCGNPPRLASGELDCVAICPSMGGGSQSCYMGGGAGDVPTLTVQCTYCVIGRRVEGFAPALGRDGDAVGRFYAAVSQLEAASVVAFETLARELTEWGAPEGLVAAALAAADDERRHTRITREVALIRGAAPAALPRLRPALRSLREMALDNAVEGCVRETFGALVATWQSQHAAHHDIARAMDTIATDETRHAALSWSVAAWLDTVLDRDTLAQVKAARVGAATQLLAELAAPVDPALVCDAGMPSPARSQRLAREMFAALQLAA